MIKEFKDKKGILRYMKKILFAILKQTSSTYSVTDIYCTDWMLLFGVIQ